MASGWSIVFGADGSTTSNMTSSNDSSTSSSGSSNNNWSSYSAWSGTSDSGSSNYSWADSYSTSSGPPSSGGSGQSPSGAPPYSGNSGSGQSGNTSYDTSATAGTGSGATSLETNAGGQSGSSGPWYSDDWTDWVNPASWLASMSSPLGERIGTGYGAATNFSSEWRMNNRLHELREQRIAQELLSNDPQAMTATEAYRASFGSKFRVVGETCEDLVQVGDGILAAGELTCEVVGVLEGQLFSRVQLMEA